MNRHNVSNLLVALTALGGLCALYFGFRWVFSASLLAALCLANFLRPQSLQINAGASPVAGAKGRKWENIGYLCFIASPLWVFAAGKIIIHPDNLGIAIEFGGAFTLVICGAAAQIYGTFFVRGQTPKHDHF